MVKMECPEDSLVGVSEKDPMPSFTIFYETSFGSGA